MAKDRKTVLRSTRFERRGDKVVIVGYTRTTNNRPNDTREVALILMYRHLIATNPYVKSMIERKLNTYGYTLNEDNSWSKYFRYE